MIRRSSFLGILFLSDAHKQSLFECSEYIEFVRSQCSEMVVLDLFLKDT